jgi:YD repeat-containing protein
MLSIIVFLGVFTSTSTFAITYTYDKLNRLSTITYDNGITVTYAYDQWGNRKTQKNARALVKSGETGSLIVTISPQDAVDAGAKWQADDSDWQDSGATVTDLDVGQHTLTFSDVQGWTTPVPQTVQISLGETSTASGTYIVPNNSLIVTITPQGAVDAGAQWQVDAGFWRYSGETVLNLDQGEHALVFNDVPGWITPVAQTITIVNGQATTPNGVYVQLTGSLTVTISPQDAVTAGAQWQVDGGDWQNSGASVSGLGSGQHALVFKEVSGWFMPDNQTVTIVLGQVSTASGTYILQTSSARNDFNGDGRPDILWRNGVTGENLVWYMDGSSYLGYLDLPPQDPSSNWVIVGTNDFNADGKTDIVWRNSSTGSLVVWYMDRVNYIGSANLPTEPDLTWTVAGIGDFNNDGKPDILWRKTSTGENRVWYMNGVNYLGSSSLPSEPDQNWQIMGVGDFNGDGKSDILWRNVSTGDVRAWLMDGVSLLSSANLPSEPDLTYTIEDTGDLNGDGKPDILWRNTTTGEITVWLLDGVNVIGTLDLGSVGDQNWQIMGRNGAINVTITPQGAINAGAKWGIDGGDWQDSGTRLTCLGPGQHTLTFNAISGWIKPDDQTVTIMDGRVATAAGTYIQLPGSLTVTISPQGPIDAGAKWSVDGGNRQNSGGTVSGLADGQHVLIFSDVYGWATPDVQTVTIENGQPVTAGGTYVQLNNTFSVTILPQRAVNASAQWRVDGNVWQNSGTVISNLNVGEHLLEFKDIAGWTTPASSAVEIVDGQANTATGNYFPQDGTMGNDFNGDGTPDIVWRNTTTGENIVWYMGGVTNFGQDSLPTLADLNWAIVAVGDFNRDGKPDLVSRNLATGENLVLYMDGATYIGQDSLPALTDLNWAMAGVGDFNGDGKADLLWRNTVTGENKVWYMDGINYLGTDDVPAEPNLAWNIVAIDDFHGNGKPDIVWRNISTGENKIWHMDGVNHIDDAALTSVVDQSWTIVGAGDFNGDGKADILWRNTVTGENQAWYMNGVNYLSYADLDPFSDPNWEAVGQSGSQSAVISPQGALDSGAQWRVDGGNWQNSGAVVPGLCVGLHTLEYKGIAGWTTPGIQAVTINGQASTAAVTYIRQTGSVTVTISPAGAVSAGAQWQVDGGAWQNSGATVSSLTVGQHTLGFNTIAGWTTPNSQTVAISNGQTTSASSTYIQQTGSVAVTISPAGAISAGAQWQVDGGAWQNSGATVSSLTVGQHTLGFNTIAGWTTPNSQTVAISNGQTTSASGTYIQQFGSLNVTITPQGAVSAGAKWQVDGGAWQNSGATVSSLTVGQHTLGFNTIAGWTTPASQSVTISNVQTTSASGTYIQQFGSLSVTITPQGAVSAGAKWQVDGGAWQNSGATVSSLTVGQHTLGFNTIAGWTTPANQPVTISNGQTTTAGGTYVQQTFTVSPSAGPDGSISPSTAQSVVYGATTSFTLTPDTGYIVGSATGCGGTLSGSTYITGPITGNCSVSAAFVTSYPIMNVRTNVGDTSLQSAYNAAQNGDILLVQSGTITEDFTANQNNISVTIDGGYNSDYSANPGTTTIKGAATISAGTVTWENFVISN